MTSYAREFLAHLKLRAGEMTTFVGQAEESARMLCTAPDENREYWRGEAEGFCQLRFELLRYARLCERAERALAKGLKRKRWEKRV